MDFIELTHVFDHKRQFNSFQTVPAKHHFSEHKNEPSKIVKKSKFALIQLIFTPCVGDSNYQN